LRGPLPLKIQQTQRGALIIRVILLRSGVLADQPRRRIFIEAIVILVAFQPLWICKLTNLLFEYFEFFIWHIVFQFLDNYIQENLQWLVAPVVHRRLREFQQRRAHEHFKGAVSVAPFDPMSESNGVLFKLRIFDRGNVLWQLLLFVVVWIVHLRIECLVPFIWLDHIRVRAIDLFLERLEVVFWRINFELVVSRILTKWDVQAGLSSAYVVALFVWAAFKDVLFLVSSATTKYSREYRISSLLIFLFPY